MQISRGYDHLEDTNLNKGGNWAGKIVKSELSDSCWGALRISCQKMKRHERVEMTKIEYTVI